LEKVESFFVAKRKKGLIISPKDWLVIERWQEEGMPLQIVLKGIENTFNNADSSAVGGKSKIHRLSYCEAEIRNLWEKKVARPVDSEQELSLVESLNQISMTLQTAATRQKGEIARAISDYAHDVARMQDEENMSITQQEARLREILAQLADELQALIEPERLNAIQQAVEAKLKNYRQAMEPKAYRKTFRALLRDRLLESFGISELSIL
jgi:hypothetical protein